MNPDNPRPITSQDYIRDGAMMPQNDLRPVPTPPSPNPPDPFALATERLLLALILTAGKSRVAGDERLAKAMARAAELLRADGERCVGEGMK